MSLSFPHQQHSGIRYSLEVVERVMEALEIRNLEIRRWGKARKESTYRAIATSHGIRDKETVRQCDLYGPELMTDYEMHLREDAKVHNLLLGNRKSEDTAAGWVVFTDIIMRGDTSPTSFRRFLASRFEFDGSPSWVTAFLTRSHLSLKKVVHMATSEFQDDKRKGLIQYIRTVRSLHLKDGEIFAIDKTRFSQRSSSNVQITLKGTEYFFPTSTSFLPSLFPPSGVSRDDATQIGASTWRLSIRCCAQTALSLLFTLKQAAI
jgi:hypothetical protein